MHTNTQALPQSKLTKHQKKIYGPRAIAGYGVGVVIKATVRHDDECGNGHNSFSITADIYKPGARDTIGGGCCHDDIARVFPELAPFIKFHLFSTDGPIHTRKAFLFTYIANTVYLAGDRDCRGYSKGQPTGFTKKIFFGDNPILHSFEHGFVKFLEQHAAAMNPAGPRFDFEVVEIAHSPDDQYKFEPKYTFGGFGTQWYECPFNTEAGARNFLYALQNCQPQFTTTPTGFSEGKERELDSARRAACWPEATDDELTTDGLVQRLVDRLPALMNEFKAAVESLGLTY